MLNSLLIPITKTIQYFSVDFLLMFILSWYSMRMFYCAIDLYGLGIVVLDDNSSPNFLQAI